MFDPVSTYRLQFHSGFNFSDFERVIPYLHQLGIKTVYASPIFKAIPGSTHGYDVLNPLEINPEIGTIDQLRSLQERLQKLGIQWLQDIVPNHMAYHTENNWLADVLEKGQKSQYARFFDIDWSDLLYKGRLMAPFLGESLDDTINNGHLKVIYIANKLALDCNGSVYPLKPLSYFTFSEDPDTPEKVQALFEEINLIEKVTDLIVYGAKWNEWLERFSALQQNLEVQEWISNRIDEINNDHELLRRLINDQHYRLCFWQETDKMINYRRFFTVNALISLNIQNEPVFQHHHQLVRSLLEQGIIQGIRVDHIDGLYNPGEYLRRLRMLAGDDAYIAVEKILEPDEKLPAHWLIQGATGYEFLAMVSNLLTQKKNEKIFTQFYDNLIRRHSKVPQQVRDKKTYILNEHMAGDLDNLYRLFLDMNLVGNEQLQSLLPGTLKQAIGTFLIHCPVYRFYGDTLPLAPGEAGAVLKIFKKIKESAPGLLDATKLLEHILLERPHEGNKDFNSRAAHFYQRCMQFSGPLMAKGVEDTLMYSFNRFIAHNEVGDAPDAFGYSCEMFHQKMRERFHDWPLSLNASSTHDTKRGEDVRARLHVLTELPEQWFHHIQEWQQLNLSLKQDGAPDANDEYFIYQTVLGTYPMQGDADENYVSRLEQYLEKALREAKSHSDWAAPDNEYETATKKFAVALLDKSAPFWQSFSKLHHTIADYGIVYSLVQVILRFTCPGIPDTYQGCELWDLSFVDPDNRRPVDFEKHEGLLKSLTDREDGAHFIGELWENRFDGRIKIWLVHSLLQLRSQQQAIFSNGTYIPLTVEGEYKDNILAYARKLGETWLLVAVPMHVAAPCVEQNTPLSKLDWKDTKIVLPKTVKGKWQNLLSGETGKDISSLNIRDLFKSVPFLILKIEASGVKRGAGILLHITSLPSDFGIGDLGPEAYAIADFLYRSGQKYWQTLPLNPVEGGQGHSPYSATSSSAGNILMISPQLLGNAGLIDENDLPLYHLPSKSMIDYVQTEKLKLQLLDKAWENYNNITRPATDLAFRDFCTREHKWLHDYSQYAVLKELNNGKPWYEWGDDFKQRDEKTLMAFAIEHQHKITKAKWLQFIFASQWFALKERCNDLHIQLVGDLPFYISYDSADVWANREIFAINEAGQRTGIAGVPPDLFSKDGQLWGMPVFNWQVLKSRNYDWWIDRLEKNKQLFDLIRLDHFRAFSSFWEVPASESTAKIGEWKSGPGAHFFRVALKKLRTLPLLAEDLGDIDEAVHTLRDEFDFPGMKVLQFAFGDNFPFSEHLPHNYTKNFFVYTGTHDNNTMLGWYRNETNGDTRRKLTKYTGQPLTEANVHTVLSQLAYASVADTVILPLQDLLGLDEKNRMNIPAMAGSNWLWRLMPKQLNEDIETTLKEWMYIFERG